MTRPSITVLMPVYNAREDVFRIAIESILNQTFNDFEFIIVNDGSTNNTEETILSYTDSRIRYIRNEENLKIIDTMNKGLELARGKYIARLDSDDYCDSTRLEKQFKYMEENPNVGLLGAYYQHVPENRVVKPPTGSENVKLYLRYCQNCILHSSAMYRKSILDEHNLRYDKCCLHAEDYMLWSKMSRFADIDIYPEVLTYYRKSLEGISVTNKIFQRKMVIIVMIGNMIMDYPCDKKFMSNIQMKYAKSEIITPEEFYTFIDFLKEIEKDLTAKIAPPHNARVKDFLFSIPNDFVKSKG